MQTIDAARNNYFQGQKRTRPVSDLINATAQQRERNIAHPKGSRTTVPDYEENERTLHLEAGHRILRPHDSATPLRKQVGKHSRQQLSAAAR